VLIIVQDVTLEDKERYSYCNKMVWKQHGNGREESVKLMERGGKKKVKWNEKKTNDMEGKGLN
jgi:hypothetical protein